MLEYCNLGTQMTSNTSDLCRVKKSVRHQRCPEFLPLFLASSSYPGSPPHGKESGARLKTLFFEFVFAFVFCWYLYFLVFVFVFVFIFSILQCSKELWCIFIMKLNRHVSNTNGDHWVDFHPCQHLRVPNARQANPWKKRKKKVSTCKILVWLQCMFGGS